jgi:hypothetical protein
MDRAYYAALVGLASAALAGCSPKIGSKCVLNTDCGASGALVCDTSQPYGYCTEFNCTPNSCQDHAVCVELQPSVPGCPYDDYNSPSRTGRTFCLEHCNQDSDCRTSDGYVCANPSQPPWNAAITDDNQSQKVCIIMPDPGAATAPIGGSLPDGSVCSASGPLVPPINVGGALADAVADTGSDGAGAEGGPVGGDAASDGGADAGIVAGLDAGVDGGTDGALDDGGADDGAIDSSGAQDTGVPDAQGGG